MDHTQKLHKLREAFAKEGVDGFLVPRADEFQGEYVPECAERLAWLTGFTGSAGLAIILTDKAMVMSDGRYTTQLANQVDKGLYELVNSRDVKSEEWLKKNAGKNAVIGYDPKLHTPHQIKDKEDAGIKLKPITTNPVDAVWSNRPKPPQEKVQLFPEKFAGATAHDKIQDVQKKLKYAKADAVVLTMPDSIAWLFNIRGNDVPHIPVALSYAIIPAVGKAQWFIEDSKITDEVRKNLQAIVEIKSQQDLPQVLEGLGKQGKAVMLDPERSSVWFKNLLEKAGASIVEAEDPCVLPRACKNASEQAAMRASHIRDGVAIVKFLKWLDEEAPKEKLTELSVEAKLEALRAEAPEFREPSFSTIAGYGEHGAIVHYRANKQTNSTIKLDNLLLLDSGGQYEDGTTDITRTMAIGTPTQEMKERFTLVLKGHIALASAHFKQGTMGKELDVLARKPLTDNGFDYAHGTGHGVGCYLSVHEAAANINDRSEKVVKAGMVISNEPGYYKDGEYGIRIENLLMAQEADDGSLYFDTITLAPIDRNLIATDMLGDKEKEWLNAYHERVFKTLSPLLDKPTSDWLKQATLKL